MSLEEYHRKRDFERTQEPKGGDRKGKPAGQYLIQKHDASRLHYDFRLELDGVLKSWAVPKGPSLDPEVKVLAVHVEDHPLEYGTFEGTIPEGEYGGGTVMLWDRGTWQPEGDAAGSYKRGKLIFTLHGERLKGQWALIRMSGKAGQNGKNWLLKKLEDDEARPGEEGELLKRDTTSITTGRTMDEISGHTKAKPKAKSAKLSKKSTKPKKSESPDCRVKSARGGHQVDASSLAGAKRMPMPESIKPELPVLVKQAPQGREWLHELKLDGYRMICFIKDGKVALQTRNGHDWTKRFPTIAAAISELGIHNAILDGEVVALNADGSSNFQRLQNLLRRHEDDPLAFFLFDLIYWDGYDLRNVPLIDRKQTLARLLGKTRRNAVIRYSDHITGQGGEVYTGACSHGLEGVVAKRADSCYTGRRSGEWVKVKCLKRQEFVIGGWTEPGGMRESLGAILVGHYRRKHELVYCGRVGTGFSQESLRDLHQSLRSLASDRSPFCERLSRAASDGVHWVEPRLVAEVAFAAWTDEGILRHASFQGIREDKEPQEITKEQPVDKTESVESHVGVKQKGATGRTYPVRASDVRNKTIDTIAGVKITHPDRVLFEESHVTKRDLALYYEAVAQHILPHLIGRPLSVVRCPEGSEGTCFFQKNLTDTMPDAVHGITVHSKKAGNATYIAVDDIRGLISLVQMGVLEIHPWGSRKDRLDRPDRLIIDIDPAPDVAWAEVVRAAKQVKERLSELGLTTFVRTTGGKGLHVVAPLSRRASWEELKTFAKAFADCLVRQEPKRYIAKASKAARAGKLFIDYLRNEEGATAVASYSTRARPGATVATPISWEELSNALNPLDFNTHTVPQRLEKGQRDPWEEFFEIRQTLTRAMLQTIHQW